jgi:uncharacterized membrane protein (DUF485 family)
MIFLYVLFLLFAVFSFVLTKKFGIVTRISIALAIFIISSIIATVWITKVGDKPPPDAKTIRTPGEDK